MDDFLKWSGFIGTIIGIILGGFGTYYSFWAFRETKKTQQILEKDKARLNEPIKLLLTDKSREYEILPPLSRREFTRSEIQGRLGTIPRKKTKTGEVSKSYDIKYTNNIGFYEQITRVSNGSNEQGDSEMIVHCLVMEFDQFVFPTNSVKSIKKIEKPTSKKK